MLTSYDSRSISLKLAFEFPLSISVGVLPDIVEISFMEPGLFVSAETGKAMRIDSRPALSAIPKQFPSEDLFELVAAAGSTVQFAANTAFLSQFGVTIFLAVSLKAMWNLMHVMQVMAYLRLVVAWPANSHMMLKSMHNAITLENIFNEIMGKESEAD